MKINIISKTAFCLLVLLLSAAIAVIPAAALPGDADGDYDVTEEELTDALFTYMKATFLEDGSDALTDEELSLAAHNCLKLPYGRIVVPVSEDSNLVPTPNALNVKASQQTLLYEGLVTRDRSGEFHGWLVEEGGWDISSDGKTWTFHLVENAEWQDGTPFTSADVKFTFDYMTDPANNLKMGFVLSDVESVECPDEHTAVFHMKSCQPMFLDRLSGGPGIGIFPEHIWESCTDPEHEQDTEYIGTGPFRFVNKEPGISCLEANMKYHGDLPLVNEVVKTVMSEESSQVQALKDGKIDLMGTGFGITPASANALKGEANIDVFKVPYDGNVYEIAFNSGKYPGNITGFRKALSHAVNRNTMTALVGNGYARATHTAFLLPPDNEHINHDTDNRFEYDIELAKDILSGAGFTIDNSGPEPVLKDPAGEPVTLSLVFGGKAHRGGADEKMYQVLKQDWEDKLGITLTTEEVNDKKLYKKAVSKSNIHFSGMPMWFHNDIDDLDDFQCSPLKFDYYQWHNETFDNLITQLDATVDPDERQNIGDQLQEVLAGDAPMIPVCSMDSIHAYRSDRFTGFEESVREFGGDIYIFSQIKPVSVDVATPEK